jgi:hypothetical protein
LTSSEALEERSPHSTSGSGVRQSQSARTDLREPEGSWLRLTLGFLAALVIIDQSRLIYSVTRTITSVDQTTHWYAAREWGRLRPRQLNFYGQSYGSNLEAVPLEALRRFGIQLSTGSAIVWAVLGMAGWFVLAWVAWRRRKPVLAAAALACPLVLSAFHSFFIQTLGSSVPRLGAVGGAAILMLQPRRTVLVALAWSLLGLGVVFDGAVALLAVPVAAWYLLVTRIDSRAVLAAVFGAVLPVAVVEWSWVYYRRHPDYNLHGGNPSSPSVSLLTRHLKELDRFLDLYVPELWRSWTVPLLVLGVLVAALLATRRWRYVIPALSVVVLAAWAIAVPKSDFDSGKFLPLSRVLIMLPATLWFLAFLLADAHILRAPTWLTTRRAVAFVGAVALISFAVRNIDYDGRVMSLREDAITQPSQLISFTPTSALSARCKHVEQLAHEAQATLVVYLEDWTAAYGCGALLYGEIDTLLPAYERRTWRLYDELHRTRSSMVVSGTTSSFCAQSRPPSTTCAQRDDHAAIVTFAPQSVLRELTSLHVEVRPFGPQCSPQKRVFFFGGFHFDCAHPIDISP